MLRLEGFDAESELVSAGDLPDRSDAHLYAVRDGAGLVAATVVVAHAGDARPQVGDHAFARRRRAAAAAGWSVARPSPRPWAGGAWWRPRRDGRDHLSPGPQPSAVRGHATERGLGRFRWSRRRRAPVPRAAAALAEGFAPPGWSDGQTEGRIDRPGATERRMPGRAGLDLLERRPPLTAESARNRGVPRTMSEAVGAGGGPGVLHRGGSRFA